jgi:hypothetical protein
MANTTGLRIKQPGRMYGTRVTLLVQAAYLFSPDKPNTF